MHVRAQVGPLILPTKSMIQMDPVAFHATVIEETAFGAPKTLINHARKTRHRTAAHIAEEERWRTREEERRVAEEGRRGRERQRAAESGRGVAEKPEVGQKAGSRRAKEEKEEKGGRETSGRSRKRETGKRRAKNRRGDEESMAQLALPRQRAQ